MSSVKQTMDQAMAPKGSGKKGQVPAKDSDSDSDSDDDVKQVPQRTVEPRAKKPKLAVMRCVVGKDGTSIVCTPIAPDSDQSMVPPPTPVQVFHGAVGPMKKGSYKMKVKVKSGSILQLWQGVRYGTFSQDPIESTKAILNIRVPAVTPSSLFATGAGTTAHSDDNAIPTESKKYQSLTLTPTRLKLKPKPVKSKPVNSQFGDKVSTFTFGAEGLSVSEKGAEAAKMTIDVHDETDDAHLVGRYIFSKVIDKKAEVPDIEDLQFLRDSSNRFITALPIDMRLSTLKTLKSVYQMACPPLASEVPDPQTGIFPTVMERTSWGNMVNVKGFLEDNKSLKRAQQDLEYKMSRLPESEQMLIYAQKIAPPPRIPYTNFMDEAGSFYKSYGQIETGSPAAFRNEDAEEIKQHPRRFFLSTPMVDAFMPLDYEITLATRESGGSRWYWDGVHPDHASAVFGELGWVCRQYKWATDIAECNCGIDAIRFPDSDEKMKSENARLFYLQSIIDCVRSYHVLLVLKKFAGAIDSIQPGQVHQAMITVFSTLAMLLNRHRVVEDKKTGTKTKAGTDQFKDEIEAKLSRDDRKNDYTDIFEINRSRGTGTTGDDDVKGNEEFNLNITKPYAFQPSTFFKSGGHVLYNLLSAVAFYQKSSEIKGVVAMIGQTPVVKTS